MIAIHAKLNARNVSVETYNEEIVIILIPTNLVICCYYRPRTPTPNIKQISNILSSTKYKYSNCNIILLGDMYLSGLDWVTKTIKPNSSYKATHLQFLNMLYEYNLHQMVTEPTHIHGNTLDLICLSNILTTDPQMW